MRALVVIPTYEESGNIIEVLKQTRAAAPNAEILVVDDASPDGTADLAERAGTCLGNIHVLRRAGKRGLGSAYRDGFAWGLARNYETFVEMDADLSHAPALIPTLLRHIEAGASLCIGSRYIPGGSIPRWSWVRRGLSRWGNRYASWALSLPVADVTSGFRAYSAQTLRSVGLSTVRADGYGFQIEMAYRVGAAQLSIEEVPIDFRDRTRGTSKMSGRIVTEALVLVTMWGVRDALSPRQRKGVS